MKFLFACLLLSCPIILQAQDFRLSYDPATIPELYNTTTVIVEQRTGTNYQRLRGNYKLSTKEADLKGNRLSYSPEYITAAKGKVNFVLKTGGQERSLALILPYLEDIRFNLYTDSIKPVLNYYVNVEGVFSSGRVFPLAEDMVTITSEPGTMRGNEWVVPPACNFEKVQFTATSKYDPSIKKSATVYIKKYKDPRDEPGYEEGGTKQNRRR